MFNNQSINKIQAAERQLQEAITLFFEERDPIAIHTLAMAAHEILHQLCRAQGITEFLKDSDYMKAEYRKKWTATEKMYANFFKHSGKDKNATIDFPEELNVFMLGDAIMLHKHLTQSIFLEGKIFYTWFWAKHPDCLNDGPLKNQFLSKVDGLDPDNLGKFLALIVRIKA
jgi:hypothetical protein